ncbi:hypothetical protein A2380_00105 [candidate division WWE3 bacterium RIFOXYB1_FULL_43_24]|uniref:Uncharacterized protein n=1 Tax=candidate division WWE3 bacterium GW2011_GWB1_42_6 TaxID=1619115 RepID=A0A0G1DU97_UNCKA|nr:MAG: hypothetical protein UU92_C0022G0008 [candidate division WWE3 bacterium GW2011_GWA1_42_12]KKS33544.1 MAG: hypothetical protein UU97_C0027G0007 [candidate division WWE3 bacterium GW2011_GWD1_42_14]KKS65843.1 MAG: hypothetical protein UV35_C0031G0008 [candidate division WWE3 bacterium GW2011_GWB1_42_6]OGC59578.1 MAG: hypothetical protein A2212_03170 [candidate division WWE3 bacterium RIFOXYA1_FULL_42_9]OGC69233.1 MAG: hypothetical protein A2380_00105 [candidate division WWE3 bacterium RIF
MEPSTPQKTTSESASKVTVFLLIFFFPLGIVVMWFWPKWKLWIKLGLTLVPLLIVAALLFAVAALDPTIEEKLRPLRNCIAECSSTDKSNICVRTCEEKFIEENTRGF